MRTIFATFILISMTLLSCRTKTNKQLDKDIVGEWAFVKTEHTKKSNDSNELPPPPPFEEYTKGYIFFENKNCENKLGYYKVIEGDKREERKTFFLGNKTKYKIEDDSLGILDLGTKTWELQKIVSIIGDTLTFQISDSVFTKYARTKYKINPNESYDEIIISSSGCYGSCPILDISIDKNGNILYFGQHYNTQNGLFTAKITKEKYQEIETTFKKADIPNLKDSYEANWTDDEEVTISFIKDNKIVKSISDYGRKSPIALIWAYMPVRHLYQQVNLIPYKTDKPNFPTWGLSFENGQQICNLSKSERFYLLTEILRSKEVTQNFEKKYTIDYWSDNDKEEKIETDGRYFKFADKTVDIGYNFLIGNNLMKRFRTKNHYER